MKTKYILYAFLALLILPFQLNAQKKTQGNLSGNVKDEQRKALENVSLSLLLAKDSSLIKKTISTQRGSFIFDQLPEGNYLLALNLTGYAQLIKGPFTINSGTSSITVSATLMGLVKQLNNVNITSKKPLIERRLDRTVLNIENSTLAAGNTAFEILQKAPGVSIDQDGIISLNGRKGVSVMIDDKLTYLSNEELTNLLNATEGNAIRNIELITHPSAKYDAAGTSGIINIKLKKNVNYGTNGSVMLGIGQSKNFRSNSGLTLNHRQKKFNLFGDLKYSETNYQTRQSLDRVNNTSALQTFFNQNSLYHDKLKNHTYKTGLDYFINARQTIGFTVNGNLSRETGAVHTQTIIGNDPLVADSTIKGLQLGRFRFNTTALGLNYKAELDTQGREISLNADFINYTRDKNDDYENNYLLPGAEPLKPAVVFRNASPSFIKVWAFKADYTHPLNKKIKFTAGLKTSLVNTDNNSVFENFIDNEWQNDTTRTNTFIYDENINAAYVNLQRQFKGLSIQFGLRAEQTNSKGNAITARQTVKRNYFDLFPTLFISQVLSTNNELGFSFSRRIDRPGYSKLNPFLYFLDTYSYYQGNPLLKPQYTNSFELSYTFKKRISASFGFHHTTDVNSFVVVNDTLRKTSVASNLNLGELNAYNVNISVPLTLAKWWSSNNNFTVFYNKLTTPDLLGAAFSSGRVGYNLNTTQTFTLTSTLNAELSGFYYSKRIDGAALTQQMYSIDAGIGNSFLNKNLMVKLAVNDVFNILKYENRGLIPLHDFRYRTKGESRVFRLTASYRFGNSRMKNSEQRVKGADEEQRRITP